MECDKPKFWDVFKLRQLVGLEDGEGNLLDPNVPPEELERMALKAGESGRQRGSAKSQAVRLLKGWQALHAGSVGLAIWKVWFAHLFKLVRKLQSGSSCQAIQQFAGVLTTF